MKHRGEILEKAVRNSGISITKLAKLIKISRRHLYNIFNKHDVNIETVIQIGKIIHYDFSKELKEISQLQKNEEDVDSISMFNETNLYNTDMQNHTLINKIIKLETEIKTLKARLQDKDTIIKLLKRK